MSWAQVFLGSNSSSVVLQLCDFEEVTSPLCVSVPSSTIVGIIVLLSQGGEGAVCSPR